MRRICLPFAFLVFAGPSFAQMPPPPVPPENPITPEKTVLGKILFWDEQLSSDNTMSCGTCHLPERGGASPVAVRTSGFDGILDTEDDVFGARGITRSNASNEYRPDPERGFLPQSTGRWAQTAIAAQYARRLFWDGSAPPRFRDPVTDDLLIRDDGALESQSLHPLVGNTEMAHRNRDWFAVFAKIESSSPLALATDLPQDMADAIAVNPTYADLFAAAFGDPAIDAGRIAFALATYERTLIPDQTPFDLDELNDRQQRGRNLFRGEANCTRCHRAPIFSNDQFINIGLRPSEEDQGRFRVTRDPDDRGAFKTPSLRNAGLRRRFMHNGMFRNLREVLEFYNRGGDFHDDQDRRIDPLNLSDDELGDLVAFLRGGLTDPRVRDAEFPFDRPTLWSERTDPSDLLEIYGEGSPGTGGFVPQMLARTPANLGNVDFKFGVHDVLGGAPVLVTLSAAPAPPDIIVDGVPIHVDFSVGVTLVMGLATGVGEGEGRTTLLTSMVSDPALAGFDFYAQWFVVDLEAASDLAASSGVRFRVF